MSPDQGPLWGSERLLPPARAAAIHVAGELLFVAACWRLSVDLMPSGAPGEFQSVFAIGQATAQMLAPALMTTVVIGWGPNGWLLLAAVFVVAAGASTPATRWALRTRQGEGEKYGWSCPQAHDHVARRLHRRARRNDRLGIRARQARPGRRRGDCC